MMEDVMKKIGMVAIAIVLSAVLFFGGSFLGLWGHSFSNYLGWRHNKIDEATRYETIKKVEDTARSMIASYKADKVTYETFKDDKDPYNKSLADNARIRANKTAVLYNEYYLKNSFVWSNNIPADIDYELPIIK